MATILKPVENAFDVSSVFVTELRIRIGPTAEDMLSRFDEFADQNRHLNLEQDCSGEIVIMPPTGAEGSSNNSEIARQLGNWAISSNGRVFDSSALFILPSGAKRSPDAAWIQSDRWLALPDDDRKKFPKIAPDFVIELRSETDRLSTLQTKMKEYIDNGVRLAWLIDPMSKKVHVYQIGKRPVILDKPISVSGGSVLVGFMFDLARIL